MARLNLTEDQKQFIRNNYLIMEYCDIAKEVGMNLNTLYWWCSQNGLRKRRRGRKQNDKLQKKIIKVELPKTISNRPPADHTNPSREDHINRILNIQL